MVASPQWARVTSTLNSALKTRFSEAELAQHYVNLVRCPCHDSFQSDRRHKRLAQLDRELRNAGV
jgi:hypothetical protein